MTEAREERKKTFYIATPIYYPSSDLHIGHTYCTVMADSMARFRRLQGYDVMFLTGTDEHGMKIARKAEEAGVTPQQYVDDVVGRIQELWKTMEISNDDFIRTTQERHIRGCQAIFRKMKEKGDIYLGKYEGWYCTPCESYWTETQLVNGCCPDCGRPVEWQSEDAYFFRLSKYQDRLLDLLENQPEFLEPEARRNEMIEFVKQGLDDLCVSRSTFDWGIPVPGDEKHVMYVWIDALSNYLTALGYPEKTERYEKFWPTDINLVGKEIVRFHSLIWPAMLWSIDEPLPKHVKGHGWLLIDGGKMSKSKGNVVDPVFLIGRYGVDALKYFILREYTFGQDGVFTNEVLLKRINYDLANDLGNLLSRTVAMIKKYRGCVLPAAKTEDDIDRDLKAVALAVAPAVEKHMDNFAFNNALEAIWTLVRRTNKYIDEKMPWALAKDPEKADELDTCLCNLAEALRVISVALVPYMHTTSERIRAQLGIEGDEILWKDAFTFGVLPAGTEVKPGDALFPRIDMEKELAELEEIKAAKMAEAKKKADREAVQLELKPEITIDDFDKIDLRVGTIMKAERHPKADKLLVFKVRIGSEERQILSGVAKDYKPEDLVGKQVIVVANLKARELRGMESAGMILFADNGGKMVYATAEAEDGSVVK